MPKLFETGDVVLVDGPPGQVLGEVLHASTPDEMPDLGPGSCSKETLDLMREMRVDLILLIGHKQAALGVDCNGMRSFKLTGSGPLRSPAFDELSVL